MRRQHRPGFAAAALVCAVLLWSGTLCVAARAATATATGATATGATATATATATGTGTGPTADSEPASLRSRTLGAVVAWTGWLSEAGVVAATLVQLPLWVVAGCTTGFTVLTLLSGFLFGAASGVASAWIGASVGSAVAFAAGRSFLRTRLTRWIHTRKDQSLLAVHRALAAEDARLLLLVRLSPFFPFAPVSYLFALSPSLTLQRFLAASSLGILPRILLTALAGSTIQSALHLLAAEHNNPYAFFTLVWGLLATLVLVIVISIIVRKALRKALDVEAKEVSA